MSNDARTHAPSGRGVPLARRMIAFDRLRFAITIASETAGTPTWRTGLPC